MLCCVFCNSQYDGGFYLREVGQVNGRPIEVTTCEEHFDHVLSAEEQELINGRLEELGKRKEPNVKA